MADTTLLPGLDVAWVALGSLGAAAATALGATAWARRGPGRGPGRGTRVGWLARVTAGDAWTATDSWLTNVTLVTGVLSSMWSRLTFSGGVLSTGAADAQVFVLFLLFTASAGLAPVVYAACGSDSGGGSGDTGDTAGAVTGTVLGYLLAAVAVLFGAFGMMAALSVYMWDALGQAPATRAVVLPFIGLGALLTAVYAARTVVSVLRHHTVAAPDRHAVPTPATASFLVGADRGRRSATL